MAVSFVIESQQGLKFRCWVNFRVTPDLVFDKNGVNYAGPFYIKYGCVRKPTIVKSYASVFVSLSVKAVHIELVLDLTAEAA